FRRRVDREAAHVRARAQRAIFRSSGRSQDRARRGRRQLHVRGARARRRGERAVPSSARTGGSCAGDGGRAGSERGVRANSMFVTKKALPRRTFLRGVGASLALPFLDSMLPAFAADAPRAQPRFAFVYAGNGIVHANWVPKTTGRDFALP